MITTADLKAQTRRELADLARNYGVTGWHSLRKDELVHEIKKVQRRLRRQASSNTKSSTPKSKPKASRSPLKAKANSKTRRPVAVKAKSPISKRTVAKTAKKSTKGPVAKNSRAKSPVVKASGGFNTAPKHSTATDPSAADSSAAVADNVNVPVGNVPVGKALVPASSKPIPKLPEPKVSAKTARIRAQIRTRRETMQRNRDLSTDTLVGGAAVQNGTRAAKKESHRDRIVLMVRDSYWLQASWEITRASVQRAESTMAERWHTAAPTLRVLSVGDVSSNCSEIVVRDIPVHGGVDSWYIDVDDPPSQYRVVIGYLASNGEFYSICRSNVIETPRPGACERLDEHWRDIAEDYERIYSLSGGYETDCGDLKEVFEERLHRAMPLRGTQGQTVGNPSLLRQSKLPFEVDAELIVFGKTSSSASVTVAGRPVKLQPDGSFTVRMEIPDKRQVLPVTAESRDGLRQRTTVLAIERNTKVMEAVELNERL